MFGLNGRLGPVWALSSALLVGACEPIGGEEDELPFGRLEAPELLATEVAVPIRLPATVSNEHPEFELVIGEINFTPDSEEVIRWYSDGPFTLQPGESMTFDIWFRPLEEGLTEGAVSLVTSDGDLEATFALEGLPPTDGDGDGFSEAQGDCDDENDAVYPGAEEVCDGLDNDCDGGVDTPFDSDRDGYVREDDCPLMPGPYDCNDADATAFPGNDEECDGSDSDCNGVIDDIMVLADLQDGVCAGAMKRCTAGGPAEPDYSLIDGFESLEYSCDSLDNDCDGTVDGFDRLGDGTDDCVDDDKDGEREVDGDCDDTDERLTRDNCGPQTLVATRNDDGIATIDLNTGRVVRHDLGIRTYHGVGLNAQALWVASRDEGQLIRYDLVTGGMVLTPKTTYSPWAVEVDDATGRLLALYGDGGLRALDPASGAVLSEYAIGGAPTAWTKAPDGSFWVCNGGDGDVVHATSSRLLGRYDITTPCYGPPALKGNRLVIPGFDDGIIIEMNATTGAEVTARATRNAPVRAIWGNSDLWVTTSTERTVERYRGSDLLLQDSLTLDGQTQGLWYDDTRDIVWVAVFGNDEVVAIDRKSMAVKFSVSVPEPIYLFPMPQ